MELPAAPPRHGRTRLEVELEFVQCLANPFYLNHLAQTKLLEDERFLNYLDYLNYFRQPEYAKLLLYPTYTLGALTLLQQEQFRKDIANPVLAQEVLMDMVRRYAPPADADETGEAAAGAAAPAAEGADAQAEGVVDGVRQEGRAVNGNGNTNGVAA